MTAAAGRRIRRSGGRIGRTLLHATIAVRIAVASFMIQRGLRYVLNAAVAALVVALPSAVAAPAAPTAPAKLPRAASVVAVNDVLSQQPPATVARAQQVARGSTISADRRPMTALAVDVQPIVEHTIGAGETLATLASKYGVSAEAIAHANGIRINERLRTDQALLIPPGEGALYTVKEGDTVESVAAEFSVEPDAIKRYQRLYFEPQYFAPGQLIFVPGATVPELAYASVAVPRPSVGLQAPAGAPPAERTGSLAWPVGGVITQYFWWAHTGVDIAAPYGTGIGASEDGVVTAAGWVAVGGLRVCVAHAGGLETCYYHTGAVFVTPGQQVARGEIIASIGMTGVTTGPHVHWEATLNGQFVNPLAY
ncbi:MAG TPA: M23 family metallopeptidase [Candidatus Limnocylindrales bacterium]|nr:M23 family metallopeptidase [Candidatus Limnocylindrales bacterium]